MITVSYIEIFVGILLGDIIYDLFIREPLDKLLNKIFKK